MTARLMDGPLGPKRRWNPMRLRQTGPCIGQTPPPGLLLLVEEMGCVAAAGNSGIIHGPGSKSRYTRLAVGGRGAIRAVIVGAKAGAVCDA